VALAGAVITHRLGELMVSTTVQRLTVAAGAVLVVMMAAGDYASVRSPGPEDTGQATEIAAVTGTARRALYLAPDYGTELSYDIGLPGGAYPEAKDLAYESIRGISPQSAAQRLDGLVVEWRPDVFVIAGSDTVAPDPALEAELQRRYPVVASGARWTVYDLRAAR
jgi:hypothetical protein